MSFSKRELILNLKHCKDWERRIDPCPSQLPNYQICCSTVFELVLIPLVCVTLPLKQQTASESALPSVAVCAPVGQNILGTRAPAPRYSLLNSSFALRQGATLVPVHIHSVLPGAAEGSQVSWSLL